MANRTLGMIKMSFKLLDKLIYLSLYKSLVMPKLEFSVEAWSPHLRKDQVVHTGLVFNK